MSSKDNQFVSPDFLTAEYFQRILQKYNRDADLQVHSVKVGPCGAAGDAFASTMYRVKVVASQNNLPGLKHRNCIVKMMPTLQLARDKLGSGNYNVHEKEMELYCDVFPDFKRILKSVNENKNIFPNAIAVDRARGVLILEDLLEKKFEMADRKVGLDLNHIKLGIAKLARFHAASMTLLEENPEAFRNFDVGMFSRKNSAFHDFFNTNMDALTTEVSSWEGFEVYGKKLENLKKNVLEYSFKAYENEAGEMKVLNHGDLWTNNFMFTYDKRGSPTDAIIVLKLSLNCAVMNRQIKLFFSARLSILQRCASSYRPSVLFVHINDR